MTTTGSIKQQASMHAVDVNVTKHDLEAKFDKYWDQVKDILPESLTKAAQKGGFRKVTKQRVIKAAGGRAKFFEPALVEMVDDYLATQDRQALAYNTVSMTDGFEGQCTVTGLVHLEPAITWKKKPGIEEPLAIKMIKEPDNLIERMVDEELKRKQNDSVVLVPLDATTQAIDDNVVVVSCSSSMLADDGTLTKWNPGCLTNAKWPVQKGWIKHPDIYEALVGMKADDTKEFVIVLNENFGTDQGKKVKIALTVKQVYKKDMPAIDDDLAKTNGFNDLESYRTSLVVALTRKLEERKEKVKAAHILNELANPEVIDVEPIPHAWMMQKAQQLYMEARRYAESEADLVSRFKGATINDGSPVTDKNTLLVFLAQRAAVELVQDLVIRSWGKLKGVEGDKTLANMGSFVQNVKAELNKVVKVEEVAIETPST